MALALQRSKTFKKDLKKVSLTDGQFQKLIAYLGILLDEGELPEEVRDHALKGEWLDFREFHLGGDCLVIYTFTDEAIVLVRIGSHSQLFKS